MPARILIIEDNAANLELMDYLLKTSGYATLTARDGAEGLDVARAERLDIVVCDVQMPRVDGFEFAQELKRDANLRRIPLIAVTAAAMMGDRERVLAAGFDGYLDKPIVPETFVRQVEAFLHPDLRSVPRAPAPATTQSPVTRPASGRTILVVDNLQVHLDLATSLFENSGYRVVVIADANEALRLARQTPPDLIMSDVCMPEGSGYDFIRQVKADPRLNRIPFVFVTSTATNETDRRKGLALGAAKFLFRPIEPQELLNEIQACLGGPGER